MATQAQIKASVKHNRTKDSITIRPTKDEGAQIRAAAAAAGKSVQAYILETLRAARGYVPGRDGDQDNR